MKRNQKKVNLKATRNNMKRKSKSADISLHRHFLIFLRLILPLTPLDFLRNFKISGGKLKKFKPRNSSRIVNEQRNKRS